MCFEVLCTSGILQKRKGSLMLRERCWNKSEREERKKERKRGMEKEGKASSWCDILLLQALQEQPWFRSFEDPGEQQQLARRAVAFSRCPLPPTTDFWLAYAGRPDSDDNAFRSLRLWTPLDLVGAKPFFLRFSSFALSLSLSLLHTLPVMQPILSWMRLGSLPPRGSTLSCGSGPWPAALRTPWTCTVSSWHSVLGEA